MTYYLGKKKAVHNSRTMRTALALARHLDPLGPAPTASNDYIAAVDKLTHGDWGMMGNDQVGDCVIADDAHYLMLRTANAGNQVMITPTTQEALQQYSAVTGYDVGRTQRDGTNPTDQGTSEVDDDAYLIHTGFMGHKADVVGSIDPNNLDHVKWGVQLFGRVRLGIVVVQQMMDLFDAGHPWDFHSINQGDVEGGHDVPIVKYDPNYLYVVTWGKLQPMTYRCFAAICSSLVNQGEGEAHVGLYSDWIRNQGTSPSGFSLAQLEADLKGIIFA